MAEKLAIIIPTLNEADTLGPLLADLAAQRGVGLSVIVADGGSTDGTREVLMRAAPALPFPAKFLETPRGRGAQMNAGVREADSSLLLFLHADSRIPPPELLCRGLAAFGRARALHGHGRLAAHFGLRFDATPGDGFFYFYEAKTFTNRPSTVNGDQGLLISRDFFVALGGFDESLPFMEDARIERLARECGEIVQLPGEVVTSPRRFSAEGRFERQMLNALIRLFDAAGESGFLAEAKDIYRAQTGPSRLRLLPFFRAARKAAGGPAFWYRAGAYARENAWQLPFALDCRRARGKGNPPSECDARLTNAFSPVFDALTANPPGKALSALLTVGAFYAFMLYLTATDRKTEI